jgi:hypothetical protein
MPEITDRKNCSPEEINTLKEFLKPHYPQLVEYIEVGSGVSKGLIKSRLELAKTNIGWFNIGGIRSRKEYNSKYFLVDQVMTVLKKPQCNQRGDLDIIQKYIQEIAHDKYKSTITLLERNNETYLCDGNHSAVAFFEYYSKCGLDDINIEVFIITEKPKLRIFLIRCYNFLWYTLKNKKIQLRL